MAAGDDRRIPKALTIGAVNSVFRQLAEMIYKQEGRKGPVTIRDSLRILGDIFLTGSLDSASKVVNIPSGGIVATDVQAAINELAALIAELTAGVFCSLSNSTDQVITTATITPITYDTEIADLSGMHSTSLNTSRITITKAGVYLFGFNASWASAVSGAGRRQFAILKNGTTDRIGTQEWQGIITQTVGYVGGVDVCVVGDYYESIVFQNSGGNLNITSTTNGPSPRFWATRLSA